MRFKVVATTDKDKVVGRNQVLVPILGLTVDLEVTCDKNEQICDIQPRVCNGVDLFSTYHGRPYDTAIGDLVDDFKHLNAHLIA